MPATTTRQSAASSGLADGEQPVDPGHADVVDPGDRGAADPGGERRLGRDRRRPRSRPRPRRPCPRGRRQRPERDAPRARRRPRRRRTRPAAPLDGSSRRPGRPAPARSGCASRRAAHDRHDLLGRLAGAVHDLGVAGPRGPVDVDPGEPQILEPLHPPNIVRPSGRRPGPVATRGWRCPAHAPLGCRRDARSPARPLRLPRTRGDVRRGGAAHAARRPRRPTCCRCATVALALEAVRAGEADAAVVPLENSVEGGVAATLDELATGEPLMITREMLVPVSSRCWSGPGREPTRRATGGHPPARRGAVPPLAARRTCRDAEVVFPASTAHAAALVAGAGPVRRRDRGADRGRRLPAGHAGHGHRRQPGRGHPVRAGHPARPAAAADRAATRRRWSRSSATTTRARCSSCSSSSRSAAST